MSDAPQTQPEPHPVETPVIDLPTLAAHEARQVIVLTGDFLSTTAALITSALSFVAALAWNNFIQAWLPTVNFLNLRDPVVKDMVYALAVTAIAVASVTLISRLRKRIKGRNLLSQ
jgi:hypothetical protein